jgi:hypothetical protein
MTRVALLLFASALLPAAVRAQSRAEQAMLAAWDDSVRQVDAAPGLTALQSTRYHGSSAAADLRRALLLIRRGDLDNDRGAVELGLANAVRVAEHASGAWPQYVLARGFTVLARQDWIATQAPGEVMSESHADAVWRALNDALDRDPDFRPARQLFLELAVPGGDRTLRSNQVAVLERELLRAAPDPRALLVWARHLRATGHCDLAVAAFAGARAAGADSSVVALELARCHRALDQDSTAQAEYWAGVARLTPAGRALYRDDLAWFISADSLSAFDHLADTQVAPWLRRFWTERDATAANAPGERLLEQLRRWVLVDVRYRVLKPWQHTMYDRVEFAFEGWGGCIGSDAALYQLLANIPPGTPGDIRHREPLLDHRGLIYLRHGAPLRIIGSDANDSVDAAHPIGARASEFHGSAPAESPDVINEQVTLSSMRNESWLYLIDGEYRLLHFRGSLALGMYAPTTLSSFLPIQAGWFSRAILPAYAAAVQELYDHRHGHDALPPTCLGHVHEAIVQSRRDAHDGTGTDTDPPPLLYPWRATILPFALGSGTEDGRALISFALGDGIAPSDTLASGQVTYPVHLRVVAWQAATGATVTLDTTREFTRPRPLSRGDFIATALELPLTPGRWQIAARVRQADDSAGVYTLMRNVTVSTPGQLTLSDMVTGVEGSPPWRAPDGQPFPLNYLNGWYSGQSVELYFEVRGVGPGDGYRTSVEIRPLEPTKPGIVRIESSDVATGPVSYVRKRLGLERLAPGQYRLAITVSAAGHGVTRQHLVTILPPRTPAKSQGSAPPRP